MAPRTGLVVELRFEMDGKLVEAFLPPLISSARDHQMANPIDVFWYVQINQGKAFRGPAYGVYLLGQEKDAEAEVRRFLEELPAS